MSRKEEIKAARAEIKLIKESLLIKEPLGSELPATWDNYCGQPSAIKATSKYITNSCYQGSAIACGTFGCDIKAIYDAGPLTPEQGSQVGGLIRGARAQLEQDLESTLEVLGNLINYYKINYKQAIEEYVLQLVIIKRVLGYADITRIREARELIASFDGSDLNFSLAPDKIGYSATLERINELITGLKG